MDPVSHAALGAAAGAAAARGRAALAAPVAAAAAIVPDLDLLLRSASDPLRFLELHRQFTHSLAFAPFGALLVAVVLSLLLRPRPAFAPTYLWCLVGYVSHGLLDACTAFGTELLWPFSDRRFGLGIVAVVDPLFTLPLLLILLSAAARRSRAAIAAAVLWPLVYLGFAAWQQSRAVDAVMQLAATRGQVPDRLTASPSFANTLVWKTVYEHGGRLYVDAVRTGISTAVHRGESVPALVPSRDLAWLDPGSQQAADVARFTRLSDGYVALDPAVPNRVIELRYSLVPHRIEPYWAVELAPGAATGEHARFVTTRNRTVAQGRELLAMVLGSDGR